MSRKEHNPQLSPQDIPPDLTEELLRLYTLGVGGHKMRMTSEGLQIDEGAATVQDVLGRRTINPAEAQRLLDEARRNSQQG